MGATVEQRAMNYIEAAIAQTLRKVLEAPEGTRNDALARAAFSFGRMAAAGWISEEMASIQLLQACEANGLLKDDGGRQCGATIAGGIRKGLAATPAFLPAELTGVDLSAINIKPLDPEVVAAAMKAEEERRLAEAQEAVEAERALTSREYFTMVAAALQRHAGALQELARRGITPETAERHGLGYDDFPLGDAPEHYGPPGRRPSIVLPWPALGRIGHYDAVQYRHLDGQAPKVHWHHALKKAQVFNADALTAPHAGELFVVEGALNALTLISAGITSTIGLPQLNPGQEVMNAATSRMAPFDKVYFLCDRGAYSIWSKFAKLVPGGHGRPVALPLDPDEILIASGGSAARFLSAVRTS